MKRKFVTNLFLLLLLNGLIKPFWIFGIDRTVQNVVGAESYGLYFSLFNFSLVLNMFLDLGITNFNNRNMARHSHLLRKYLGNLVSLKFLLAIGYALVSLSLALLIGYDRQQFHLLFFLIVSQFLASFTLFLRSNISGLHLFRTDSLLSVLDRVLMIVLCSALLFTNWFGGNFTIAWFVYAQTLAYLMAALVTFVVLLRYSGRVRLNFDRRLFVVFIRKSWPFALLILLMSIYFRTDAVLLERLLPETGKEQVGIYAQAFRLMDAFTMLGVLFAGLLLPMFSRMIKQGEKVGQLVQLAFLLIMVPSVLMGVAANVFGLEIMQLLYHEHTEISAPMLGLLMAGFAGNSASYIFGTLLTANGSLKQLNGLAAGGMAVNIGLNLLLIPRFGALGAAWVCLFTQLLMAAAQLLLAVRIFRFQLNWVLILKLTGFLLFSVLAAKVLHLMGNWLAGIALFALAGLVYASLVKLIDLKALFLLFKNEAR